MKTGTWPGQAAMLTTSGNRGTPESAFAEASGGWFNANEINKSEKAGLNSDIYYSTKNKKPCKYLSYKAILFIMVS